MGRTTTAGSFSRCVQTLAICSAFFAVSVSSLDIRSRIRARILQHLRATPIVPGGVTFIENYGSSADATSTTEDTIDFHQVSFSLSAWITTSTGGIIFTNAASNKRSFHDGNAWYVKGESTFSVAENTAISSTSTVTDGKRHFLALTCTLESTGQHTYRSYVDGGEEVQLVMSPQASTSQTVYIGKTNLVSDLPTGTFNGTLENVTWYPVAMSQQNVVDLYKQGLPSAQLQYVEGLQGDRGDVGPSGDTGSQGNQGQPGPKGTEGIRGATGSKGEPGVGSPGAKGDKGDKGDAGKDGSQGFPGVKGEAGDRGGSGAEGPPGLRGSPGGKGDPGDTGAPGTIGSPGSKGDPGPAGIAGSAGSSGDKGDAGPPGPKGNPGTDGVHGQDGAPGVTGLAGAVGPRGDMGDRKSVV